MRGIGECASDFYHPYRLGKQHVRGSSKQCIDATMADSARYIHPTHSARRRLYTNPSKLSGTVTGMPSYTNPSKLSGTVTGMPSYGHSAQALRLEEGRHIGRFGRVKLWVRRQQLARLQTALAAELPQLCLSCLALHAHTSPCQQGLTLVR